ncbi:MAG TPA: AI-2E family transporter [Segeticoccus sp.]|nr:AI-2E family transporter [Segeticoccus sp.]
MSARDGDHDSTTRTTTPGSVRQDSAVTPGVLIASTWAWRLLAIAVAVFALGWGLRYLSEVVVPVVVAVLLTALLAPVVTRLVTWRVPRGPAAGLTLIGLIVVVGGLLTLVGTQIGTGFADLSDQVGQGVNQLRDLARVNFGVSDADIHQAIEKAKGAATSSGLGTKAAAVGTTATHFVAGLFVALFATFFFLFEGEQIWAWLVRLMPRRARERTDSSGHRAWSSLTAYVRATVIVAFVDAVGIAVGAWILQLPLVPAIGILVFVASFVPIVGAFVSGLVAVLVALVAQGPVVAIIMLLVVLAVQQLESHVLQPFLLGRLVRVHPLAVILSIAAGVVIAGIVGALVAVPIAAMVNAVVHHLAGHDDGDPDEGDDEPPARAGDGAPETP